MVSIYVTHTVLTQFVIYSRLACQYKEMLLNVLDIEPLLEYLCRKVMHDYDEIIEMIKIQVSF